MPTGPGEVLDLIRSGRAATRGDVLDVTGLSRMTVAQRIDALLAAGLVVENGTDRATGGRRPMRLEFNSGHSYVLASTVDTRQTRTAITDLAGRVLLEDRIDVAVVDGPERTLKAITASARELLGRAGIATRSVSGFGISVPGPVDPETGRPSQPPIMPGWDAYPIPDHLGEEFSVPVLVANDADAAALGEHTAGFPHSRALCLVKVSTGIGTGIIIDGTGDIGHVRLAHHTDSLCQCGAYGCLAAVASGRAVARELTEIGIPATSGRDVGALLARGDVDAARLTQQAGRTIGEVMATVVCLLNPGVVLVGGALASPPLLSGMQETLYPLSLPRATRHLTRRLATLGEGAALVGLTRLLVDREFSATAGTARLAA